MRPETIVNVIVEPAFVLQLKNNRRPAVHVIEKRLEPRHVLFEVRRQLEQQRPLPLFQERSEIDEIVDLLFGILQAGENA